MGTSLVQKQKQFSDKIVVSIFVNPTQFGNSNDFDQYPNSIFEDIDLLQQLDVDAVFFLKVLKNCILTKIITDSHLGQLKSDGRDSQKRSF